MDFLPYKKEYFPSFCTNFPQILSDLDYSNWQIRMGSQEIKMAV